MYVNAYFVKSGKQKYKMASGNEMIMIGMDLVITGRD